MSEAQWHFTRGGTQQAAVSFTELQRLAQSGALARSDLVWSAGMPQWVAAGSVADLYPAGSAPPPLPVQPVNYFVPPPPAQDPLAESAGIRMLIPVGRSGWAIAAGYLGLFSILVIPAPLAIIFGILAIRDIKRNPNRHGMGRAIFGIVMGALVVGLFCFGFVVRMMRL
jgi:hypothetical protein